MVLHRAGPRVEDREDAGRAADPRAIVGERLHRRRRFAQQCGVDDLLMREGDGTQRLREREGEQVVIARRAAIAPACAPASPARAPPDTWGSGDCDRSDTRSRAPRSRHSDRASRRGPACDRRQCRASRGGARATGAPRAPRGTEGPRRERCPPTPAWSVLHRVCAPWGVTGAASNH